jgi:L-serine dehydratase
MTNKLIPSIFNDVIGPVMRGPSSSHCAAALRIGRLARDLMDGNITDVKIEFDETGSLATTHKSQGSDMGLFGGILGWDMTDVRLPDSADLIREQGISVDIRILKTGDTHPNTYNLILRNNKEEHSLKAVSLGGGMIEIIKIDGVSVSIAGDYYETLLYLDSNIEQVISFIHERFECDYVDPRESDSYKFIEIKGQQFPEENLLDELIEHYPVIAAKKLSPVLPVLSRKNLNVPFLTCEKMIQYMTSGKNTLWELAVSYETRRGNINERQVRNKMGEIINVLENSIRKGLEGTSYKNRILEQQSDKFSHTLKQNGLIDAGILNRMILYTTALMEMKSSMGVIVAAPTAGACAGLPGACLAAADVMNLSMDDKINAMLAASIIGIFIARGSTFAAEVGGCQAETGAAAGMAAAALVSLKSGTVEQAISASSMALQNSLGMICDPVANRVEVPCLGKNVLAAANALTCANMALAGYDAVIPLDEVIETMNRVGKQLPMELCCTALGGLSITPTSKKIEQKLYKISDSGI